MLQSSSFRDSCPKYLYLTGDTCVTICFSMFPPRARVSNYARVLIRVHRLQPSIIGHDQAGISETVEFVLGKFPAAVQRALAANVFVTGALARLPGMRERLAADLRRVRPAGEPVGVTVAKDPGGY